MTDPLAKIWSKSYLQAANIKAVMDSVTPALVDGMDKLGAVLDVIQATVSYGKERRKDIVETLADMRFAKDRMAIRLEQYLTDFDIILRAMAESGELTEETRLQFSAAVSHLQEAGEMTAEHVNTAANAATLQTGLEYLMLEREPLEKILNLADPKLTAAILKGMGWRVKLPEKG